MIIFKGSKKDCLNDIQIVRYALKKCSDKEHREIEAHISKCNKCFNEVASLIKAHSIIMDEKEWGEAPDLTEAKEKAIEKYIDKHVLPELVNVFEIAVQFINKELLKLISHTGTIYQPAILSGWERVSSSIPERPSKLLPTLYKSFNGYTVEVKIEAKGDEAIDIQIKVKKAKKGTLMPEITFTIIDGKVSKKQAKFTRDGIIFFKEGTLVPEITFTLIDEKESKELAKFTRDGTILFKDLKPSKYNIKIAKSEKLIGTICLNLKES